MADESKKSKMSDLSKQLLEPGPAEQRRLIEALEKEEESLHVYCVSKLWYEKWKGHVGQTDQGVTPSRTHAASSEKPGALQMDAACEDNNMYVDEKVWTRWVSWYGIADQHELDRRNWASDEKEFEICILSPYSGIVENATKSFDVSEESGYIELQLSRIFKISQCRRTRLWACERARHARFGLLLDRSKEICFQDNIDHTRDYILALEVGNLDGTWPTHVPGDPKGTFDKYKVLAENAKPEGFWQKELSSTIETVFGGISNELTETVAGIVNTTKCVTVQQEKDMLFIQEKLEAKTRSVDEVHKTLNKRAKELFQDEEKAKSESRRTKKEREVLEQEKRKFLDELKKMEELNKITDSKVKLNIGGHVYMTSMLTVTKATDSMLAAMFSGRHSLKKDDDGSFFIDRDGTHFRYVLNFLRDGGFKGGTLPKDKGLLSELLTEAEYYQIAPLVKLLKDLLKAPTGDSSGSDGATSGGGNVSRNPSTKRPHRKVALLKDH